jgi:hypothetical protein
MGWNAQRRNLSTAALALAGFIAAHAAAAAPPLHMQAQSRLQPTPPQAQQHLDLRAPSHMPDLTDNAAARSFPSRRPTLAAQEAVQLPALGAEGVRAPRAPGGPAGGAPV